MLTFDLLSFIQVKFLGKKIISCVCWAVRTGLQIFIFFYLNLFDTHFPPSDLAYIQTKLPDWSTKNGISETVRDRVKRTKIWDHKGLKSQMTKSFQNFKFYEKFQNGWLTILVQEIIYWYWCLSEIFGIPLHVLHRECIMYTL